VASRISEVNFTKNYTLLFDCPAPLRRFCDSGAGYKYSDLLTYLLTSNNMKLVHRPLMGGLVGWIHLVQHGGDWAEPQPAESPPRCTKCNSQSVTGQCDNHRIAV